MIPSGKDGTGISPVRHLPELHVHLRGTVVKRWMHSSSAEHKTEESQYLLLVASKLTLELFPSFLNLKDRRVERYHFFP